MLFRIALRDGRNPLLELSPIQLSCRHQRQLPDTRIVVIERFHDQVGGSNRGQILQPLSDRNTNLRIMVIGGLP